jgi:protein involved in polysaccharide export with SLBB domain
MAKGNKLVIPARHLIYICTLIFFLIAPASICPAQPLSTFEAYVKHKGFPAVSTDIEQFGYELFKQPPSTFAPVDIVPVGPDYLLGPGDELKISLWGKVNTEYLVAIDREGNINIPQVGILHLAGLTFSEAKSFLEKEFSRYYKPSQVKMNVSMGRLRTIRVFVVGKAQRPGSYTLSSLSTLVNALFAAGGPSKIGTMRDIKVKRNGKTIVNFDLYDFLLKGDKTRDIRLMPEDVVFIPTVGPLVGIAGNVRYPAIYEFKTESNLKELIDMAGGLNEIAFKGRVQIERIIDNDRQVVSEADLEEIEAKDIKIQPGDLIRIFPVVQDKRFVRVSGPVHRAGEYGITPGMTVRDLVSLAGGLRYYAYTEEAELTRVTPTPEGPKTEKLIISLKKALEGEPGDDIPLKEDDYLTVKTVPEWELYRKVSIKGEVRFPGTYTIMKGETLSYLIERAGGFTDKAYLKGAVFTRESVKKLQQRQLDEAISRLEEQLLTQSAQTIEASLTPEEAKQHEAAIGQRRLRLAKMRAAKAEGRISIKLDTLDMFKGSPFDIEMEEGDILTIPEKPVHVQVIGSVYNENAFVYYHEAGVSQYLKKAGGTTKDADEKEMYILKVDGTAISKREYGGFFGMRWDSEDNRWIGGFMTSRLDPGDTIVVPVKIEKIDWLREAKDITQILYQIAVTAGVLIVAF